jgi:hypothetical protein
MRGIDGLDSEMRADILAGDWSNNGINNVTTDWIINFPAKYVYTDFVNCEPETVGSNPVQVPEWCLVNYMAEANSGKGPIDSQPPLSALSNRLNVCDRSGMTDEGTPWGPETCLDYRPYNAATALCLPDNLMQLWDTSENTFSLVSPSTDGLFPVCEESRVLTIAQAFETLPTLPPTMTPVEAFPSLIQYQNKRTIFTFRPIPGTQRTNRGHAQLSLNWDLMDHRDPRYEFGAATEGALSIIRRTDGIEVNNGSMAALSRLLEPRSDYNANPQPTAPAP